MENLTEKLIEAVKEHKILYDLSDKDYKNTRKKNKVWDEIGERLEIDGETAKKKFKNLKDNYAKHLRSEKTHTGQNAKFIDRYKMWPWVEQMSYLKPFLQFAQTQSNISNPDDNENDEDDDEPQPSTSREGLVPVVPAVQETPRNLTVRKRKVCDQTTKSSSIDKPSSVDKVLSYLQQSDTAEQNYDELDLICLGYAKIIRKMNPRLQTMTKFKIAKVIMEAELEQQKQNDILLPTRPESGASHFSHVSSHTTPHSIYSPGYSNPDRVNFENSNATTWYEEFSQSNL